MVKVVPAAVVRSAGVLKAKVQVSRLIVAPVPVGSFLKLCPVFGAAPLVTDVELPIVVLRAKAEGEKARVLARRAITPPFLVV
jgi:hypothetical protein